MVIEEIYGEVAQLESEPEVNQIGEVPEDVPFTVPKKWKWMPLKNVGRIVGGGTPKTSVTEYWKDGTIVWFTPADLGKVTGVYASDSERKITELGLAKSSAVLMPPNSIIFSSRAPIGYIAVATKHCCTNQGCKSFVPDLKVIDSLWGYFAIRARTPDIIARASGTTFKEISGKEVGETLIPIPPLLEQQRIVKRLIEIQTLIDSYGKEQEALEELEQKLPSELKASLLQEAIRGKLVPQLESEPVVRQLGEVPKDVPFAIPAKWKWVTLGTISKKIHYGYTASAKETGNARLLRISDIQNRVVNWSSVPFCSPSDKEISKFKLNVGDIVIARTGGTIGKSYLISDEIEKTTVFASYLIRVIPEVGYVDPAYLQAFLRSPCYWRQLVDGSRGTGQPNVNAQALSEIKVPLPSIQEQHRIVLKLKELSDKLEITT